MTTNTATHETQMLTAVSNPISKRPRLSLQTATLNTAPAVSKTSAAIKADLDFTSPTSFNTLSNAYAAAIELASPKTLHEPKAAFNIAKTPAKRTSLRLVTNASMQESFTYPSQRTQTPGPFAVVYPDTPTWSATTTPVTAHPDFRMMDSPVFTFTPPQSAHPSDDPKAEMLSFSLKESENDNNPRTLRRRATTGGNVQRAPYTHPRALHSILRNSPLPPKPVLSPLTPTRSSQRIADRVAKKVCYNNPLTQTITNNKYIKSHIDLLAEDASPRSATDREPDKLTSLDTTMAYTGDETRDGGQTPGPFEEMRRRMAGLGADGDPESPGGSKKRKRKEKKRQWVWTIGKNDEDEENQERTPISALSNDLNAAALSATEDDPTTPVPLTAIRRDPLTAIQDEHVTALGEEVPEMLLPTVYKPRTEDIQMTEMLLPTTYKPRTEDTQMADTPEIFLPTVYELPTEGAQMTDRPESSHSV